MDNQEELNNDEALGAPKTLGDLRQRLQEKWNDIAKNAKEKSEEPEDDEAKDDKKNPFFKGKDDDDDDGDDEDKEDKKPFGKKKKKGFPFKSKDKDDDGDDDDGDDEEGKGDKKNVKIIVKEEDDMEIEEETTAGASLHPGARKTEDKKALNPSRVEMMKHAVNYMAGMKKGDLTDFYTKSIALYGPGKSFGVGDVSGSNMASIDSKLGKGPKTKDPMPKIHVREDIEELLSGTELTEDFKEKTATLFEAAVHARSVLEAARLEEEYVGLLTEEIAQFTGTMTDKVDAYLDYVVENWMAENQVAVESTLRSELTSDFIEGLKYLFAEHYIEVPNDKVDVLEALAEKVDVLENRLEEKVIENNELRNAVVGAAKAEVFEQAAQGLTMEQMEKFATLAEGIEFDGDFDVFTNKLGIIKEQYFNPNSAAPKSNILEEEFEGDDGSQRNTNQYVDPFVNKYAAAITKTVKPTAING